MGFDFNQISQAFGWKFGEFIHTQVSAKGDKKDLLGICESRYLYIFLKTMYLFIIVSNSYEPRTYIRGPLKQAGRSFLPNVGQNQQTMSGLNLNSVSMLTITTEQEIW